MNVQPNESQPGRLCEVSGFVAITLIMEDLKEIRSRLYVHKQNWSIPYGLKIEGYEGHVESGYGGQYKFVATYIHPEELDGRNCCVLDIWCKQKNIQFIHANNFEDLCEKLKTFDRPELKEPWQVD